MANNFSDLVFFRKAEFACKCGCGLENISFGFVKKLDEARSISGLPFIINSACRCPAHNEEVGGVKDSSHLSGLAADISCPSSAYRYSIIAALIKVGFRRIGISKTYIHVDCDLSKPNDIFWLYE